MLASNYGIYWCIFGEVIVDAANESESPIVAIFSDYVALEVICFVQISILKGRTKLADWRMQRKHV